MPEVTDILKGEYLVPADVATLGNTALIVDGGEIVKGRFGERLRLMLAFAGGVQKMITMNKTSVSNLAKAWGENSDAWAGNEVEITVSQANVGGEMKSVIYLTPKSAQGTPPAPQGSLFGDKNEEAMAQDATGEELFAMLPEGMRNELKGALESEQVTADQAKEVLAQKTQLNEEQAERVVIYLTG